MSGRRLRVG